MSDWLDSQDYSTPYQTDMFGDPGDSFPTENFRTASFANLLNPQQSQNTIPDIMNQIGGGVQNDPVLKRYFDLANQGPPTREDYAPSTGRKILAAVGGLGSIFSDPSHAVANTAAILDRPYDLAAGQYKQDLSTAADAAKAEGGLLNTGGSIFKDIAQQQNYASLAGRRLDQTNLGQQRIDQTGDIASQKNDLARQKLEADREYQQGRLTNEQYRNITGRLQEQLNQTQSGSLIDERNAQAGLMNTKNNILNSGGPISGSRSTGPSVNRPNAAYMRQQLNSALFSDPILMDSSRGFVLPDGSLNIPRILQDPEASVAFRRNQKNYGMGPQDPTFQPQGFDINSLFNTGVDQQ